VRKQNYQRIVAQARNKVWAWEKAHSVTASEGDAGASYDAC
jgi:hypothetical protein